MVEIEQLAKDGKLFDGRYKLLRTLSTDGGTADVWLAIDVNTIDKPELLGEEAVDFNGLITVNETGAFLWKKLEEGIDTSELLAALTAEYDVDEKTAVADINAFVEKLQKADLLEK